MGDRSPPVAGPCLAWVERDVSEPTPAGMTALVLEPNLHLRQILVQALRSRGHAITVCEDAETAWEAYRLAHHPLALFAVEPDAGGTEDLARRIRGVSGGGECVVLIIGGRRAPRGLLPLLDIADDVLVKPFKTDALELRLAAAERLAAERARHAVTEEARRALEARVAILEEGASAGAAATGTAAPSAPGPNGQAHAPAAAGGRLRRFAAGALRAFRGGGPTPGSLSPVAAGSAGAGTSVEGSAASTEASDAATMPAAVAVAPASSGPETESDGRHRPGSDAGAPFQGASAGGRPGAPVPQSASETAELAGTDALTGLPNRANLMERLGRALAGSRAGDGRMPAVLFLDLDRFKNINYSLGHTVGDQMLVSVASRLRACLPSAGTPDSLSPTIAHVGGDEFAVLLEGVTDVNDAVRTAKRIQDELQAPFDVGGNEVFTSSSIGIAVGTPDYERPEDLLRDADTAMFRAKAVGKASYVVFDAGMHARAVSLLKLETELRRAVQREEFRVHYQPIVELDTGRIAGFEALVRWQHPDGELLLPKEFLAVAEETGLIIAIDRQVARDACKQLRTWTGQFRRATPLTVSVNVSGVGFMRPDMIVEIDRTLRNYGVYGRSLKLEITESVIMEHARYAADLLAQLKALDVKLSIDDFGTGYSSLSYLRRFEIDTLKVDSSFVSRMDTDEESWEIIRTIVTLGNNLGKNVVAEGIERGKQRELLLALRCKYGQGFFFSRPVDAEAATALLAADGRGESLLKT